MLSDKLKEEKKRMGEIRKIPEVIELSSVNLRKHFDRNIGDNGRSRKLLDHDSIADMCRYHYTFKVDTTNIDAGLRDFPLLVKLSAACGQVVGVGRFDLTDVFSKLAADANRKKIAIVYGDGADAEECYVEIDQWITASSIAYLHVRVPYIDASNSVTLTLFYDPNVPDNDLFVGDIYSEPAKRVWDGCNAQSIIHLTQANVNSGADSCRNKVDFTEVDAPTGSQAGQIGYSVVFDGAADYLLATEAAAPKLNLLPRATEYLVSAWIKLNDLLNSQAIVSKQLKAALGQRQFMLFFDKATKALAGIVGTAGFVGAGNGLNNTNWNHVALRNYLSGETWKCRLYLNGRENGLEANSGEEVATGIDFLIGARRDDDNTDAAVFFNGWIDEVRVYASSAGKGGSLSAAWVKAEYNSGLDNLIVWQDAPAAIPE